MSLIDQIKADREAGTPGRFEPSSPHDYADYDGCCVVILGDDRRRFIVLGEGAEAVTDAERIARLPDLEAAYIREREAAEELAKRLADCIVWMETREKMVPGMPRICDQSRAALTAYRAAVEETAA